MLFVFWMCFLIGVPVVDPLCFSFCAFSFSSFYLTQYTVANIALFRPFSDVLLPSILKYNNMKNTYYLRTIFFSSIVTFSQFKNLTIWQYVVLLWIKYWLMRFEILCSVLGSVPCFLELALALRQTGDLSRFQVVPRLLACGSWDTLQLPLTLIRMDGSLSWSGWATCVFPLPPCASAPVDSVHISSPALLTWSRSRTISKAVLKTSVDIPSSPVHLLSSC